MPPKAAIGLWPEVCTDVACVISLVTYKVSTETDYCTYIAVPNYSVFLIASNS